MAIDLGITETTEKVRLMLESRFKGVLDLPKILEIVYADITNKQQVVENRKN